MNKDEAKRKYEALEDEEARLCYICQKPLKKIPLWMDDEIGDMQGTASKVISGKLELLGDYHEKCK